jgi:hypothetical protein
MRKSRGGASHGDDVGQVTKEVETKERKGTERKVDDRHASWHARFVETGHKANASSKGKGVRVY